MKTFSVNKFGLAVATALFSMVAFTSCNKDDDMDSMLNNRNSECFTRSTSCNPEDLPENHHAGATVTKNIDGFGDAVFTCISDNAPYYFVHVTDREYSAKEMDAMHYQQNQLAVTYDMLDELGEQAVNMTVGMLGQAHGQFYGRNFVFSWDESELKAAKEKLNTVFKYFSVYSSRSGFYSPKFWVRATDEYPTGKMIIKYTPSESTDAVNGDCTVDQDSYSWYFTAGDNYLMFAFKIE